MKLDDFNRKLTTNVKHADDEALVLFTADIIIRPAGGLEGAPTMRAHKSKSKTAD